MNTILALTDFSTDSINATLYAAEMAAAFDCKLVMLNVCFIPAGFSDVPVMPDTIEGWVKDAEQKMKLLAGKVNFHIHERISVETIVKQGSVMHEIRQFCNQLNPLAIVLGAESVGAFESFFVEGLTIRALDELKWPVLVIPTGYRYRTIKKVGLTCDLKAGINTKAIMQVKYLLEVLKAELHVVNISGTGSSSVGDLVQAEAIKVMFAQMMPELHYLYDKGQEEALIRFADEHEIDILIIFPKHHPFPGNLMHKSFSKALVLKTTMPVFSIHQ